MNAVRTPTLGAGHCGECTCLNRYDTCARCQAIEEEAPRRNAEVKPPPTPLEAPPAPPPLLPLAERWLTAEEVAEVLNMGTRTIWRMVQEGRMPQPIRYTRKLVRFSGAKLAAWMRQQADDAQRAG